MVGAQAPQKEKGVYWIESPKGGEHSKWRIYSPVAWGVWTHFHGNTSPCYENHKYCANGHDPCTLRWKGYLFGFSFKKKKPCFLQMTPETWRCIEDQLASGTTLRGMTIIAMRTASNQGRLTAEVAQYLDVDPNGLPKDVDPRASCYDLWKLDDPGHKWAINPLRKADLNIFSA